MLSALIELMSSTKIQTLYLKIKCVFSGDLKSIQNEVIECISEYNYAIRYVCFIFLKF